MKMNVNELTGSKLDWAVAKCLGYRAHLCPSKILVIGESIEAWETWEPSTNWSQGGPIIEQEKINIHSNMTRMAKYPDYDWLADCPEHRQCVSFTGQTPLITAMRCYAASKLGDVIDIPEELF